ncbi:MAG: L-2-hydroxyglutarate oxidase [Chloroflexota bacterium]
MKYDIAVIGGGIIGLAVAKRLLANSDLSVVILEAEKSVAMHQTSNNSGVVHSGLYYKPGSLKAINCIKGREMLVQFCDQNNIPYNNCGKLVVAQNQSEIPTLDELERRGRANNLNLQRLTAAEIKNYEPHVKGIAGLWVPETGVLDFALVAKTYATIIKQAGGDIRTNTSLLKVIKTKNRLQLISNQEIIQSRFLINCAGTYSDRVAQICGFNPTLKILPIRGEYYQLLGKGANLVKGLVYPVPNPKLPFLGVHFTRTINNEVTAGPNAVLAFSRMGYRLNMINIKDLFEILTYIGFWRFAKKYWRTGLNEFFRSWNKKTYLHSLQHIIPGVEGVHLRRRGAGVRAQALGFNGILIDDFVIESDAQMIHVLNAPSPAATSSLSIGQAIYDIAAKTFDF